MLPRRPFRFVIAALVFLSSVLLLSRYRDTWQLVNSRHSSWLRNANKSPNYSDNKTHYYTYPTKPFFPPLKESDGHHGASNLCEGFPTEMLDTVQIVLKTGVGEREKTKAHLATISSCISNLIVVSDLEEKVEGHQSIDILADLPSSYAMNNSDFNAYTAQKEALAKGATIGYSGEGWKLDRFKFLPMVDKAYEMRPKASWYVFIETDVYYFWDTLFRLLDQLDPSRMHYMGSPSPGSYDRWFAYGGAGFVLSQGLMKRLHKGGTKLSVNYEEWIKNDCCGDAVLAYVIVNQTGARLEALYPTFAGDDLNTLRVDEERWCVPLIALHRVSPDTMKSLWEWERTRRYDTKPLVHSTTLAYTHAHLRDELTKESWDNLSDTIQPDDSVAHSSASACGQACTADSHCLQYSYSANTCRLGNFVTEGKHVDDRDFVSGWDVVKMEKLGFGRDGDLNRACKKAAWVKPTIR